MGSKNIYIPDWNHHYIGRCGESYNWGSYREESASWSDHVPEHRVRPDPPLALHPTSLTKRFRKKVFGHQEQQTTYGLASTCGGYTTYDRIHYWKYHIIPIPLYDDVLPPTDYALRLRQRIEQITVNIGESCAEYRETCGLFKKTAVEIWKAVKAAKSRRMYRNFTLKDVAKAELISSWGIAPLLGDLGSVQQRLALKLQAGQIVRVKAKGKVRHVVEKNNLSLTYDKQERGTAYLRINADLDPVNFGNPVELAYELIPFSPVIDWMTPLGDALRVVDALKGYDVLASTKATRVKATHKVINSYNGPSWAIIKRGTGTYESYQRTVLPFVELPRVPLYKPSKSVKAVMHGLSLLTILR